MKTKKPQVIALIPARAGSKRVPNKNIRLLGGKPLIAYTIEAALRSKNIDRIIVSTDSKKIASVAKEFGAEVPFLRPAKIAKSHSTEYEFHRHALDWLKAEENFVPDYLVNLYPTSPFRTTDSIESAVDCILKDKRADTLRSVIKCSEHPYKMWVKRSHYMKALIPTKSRNTQTQAYHLLPEVFIQNASIYIVKSSVVLKYKSTIGDRILPFVMSEEESVDINRPIDFEMAELLLKKKAYLSTQSKLLA